MTAQQQRSLLGVASGCMFILGVNWVFGVGWGLIVVGALGTTLALLLAIGAVR